MNLTYKEICKCWIDDIEVYGRLMYSTDTWKLIPIGSKLYSDYEYKTQETSN